MWSEYRDYHLSGELKTVNFPRSLDDSFQKYKTQRTYKRNCYLLHGHLKHQKYIQNSFKALAESINATRKIWRLTSDVKDFDLAPITEQQSLHAYFKMQNKHFAEKLSGESDTSLDEPHLVQQVFSEQCSLNQDEVIEMITSLECVRLHDKLEQRVDYINSYSASVDDQVSIRYNDQFMEQVLNIKDEELATFYFYISYVWSNICWTNQQLLSTERFQPWRINQENFLTLDFVELLSSQPIFNEVNVKFVDLKFIAGRVLPVRFPTIKAQEGVGDTKPTLLSFNYTQYIQLDSIVTLNCKENIEIYVEKTEKKLKWDKKRQTWIYPDEEHHFENKKIKHHMKMNWDEMMFYKNQRPDPSAWIYEIFRRDRLEEFQSTTSNNYGQIKEAVIHNATNGKYVKTAWITNQRPNNSKLISKDLQEYILKDGLWQLDSPTPEIVKMISKYQTTEEQQYESGRHIVDQLGKLKDQNKLLTILKQIPNLQMKLSPLQELVVTANDNILCLGRSGTGKTTSSVLRLFSQEIMYILLRKQEKQLRQFKKDNPMFGKEGLQKGEKGIKGPKLKLTLSSHDLMKPCNMKTVFISASPVLVNEVARFYERLKETLISHLRMKEAAQDQGSTDDSAASVDSKHEELMQLAQIESELIEEEMASKSQFDTPNAFEDLKPKNFPLFVTVKQLLYMFDASLTQSFFCRDSQNNIIGMDSNLSWHNENKGMFMINSQFKQQADFDGILLKYGQELVEEGDKEASEAQQNVDPQAIQEVEHNAHDIQKNPAQYKWGRYKVDSQDQSAWRTYTNQQLAFEVDFEVFEQKFYKRFQQKNYSKQNRLSAATIWTEIFSVIKGGLNSSDHYLGFLQARTYTKNHASPFLSTKERQIVYWIFLEYEKWKRDQNAFDLMDLVHHVASSSKTTSIWYGANMKMDFLMIDEVQDLTPKTLQLLLKLTTQKVYFAGDTAQTIAKGVGARFSDLRSLLAHFDTKVIQLKTNYRSHGQILALANSVVSLLETLFPFSIDKLEKEQSATTGMKPLILMPMADHELRKFFLGRQGDAQQITMAHSAAKPQFGCNQVVIVRDQAMKDNLPEFLMNMLCLTVFEAKGLEFDDVILYNFFNSGEIKSEKWKLINEIKFEERGDDGSMADIVQGLSNLVSEENEEDTILNKMKPRDKAKQVMINSSTQNRSYVYRKYAALCIELKQLYVAITRPKKRLIIYDSEVHARMPVQRVWDHLKVANIVTSTMMEQKKFPCEEVAELFKNEGGCLGTEESLPDEWKVQGIKFYKKKQFDQAIKCFRFAGETQLVTKCFAYQMADAGNSKISQADTILWRLKTLHSSKKDKAERKQMMKEQGLLRKEARKEFDLAGTSFAEIGLLTQAASCYFTAKKYLKASKIFEELGHFGQAAECLMQSSTTDSQHILKAAEMFERGNMIARAIECYERIEAWERLLLSLYKSRESFKQVERELLANKYIPIALNKLYLMMMGEEKVNEANKGVLAELKIKQKYDKQVQDTIAEEEEEYYSEDEMLSDEDDEDEEEQAAAGSEYETKAKTTVGNASFVKKEDPSTDIKIDLAKPATTTTPAAADQSQVDMSSSLIIIDDDQPSEKPATAKTMDELLGEAEDSSEEEYDILDDVFELKKKRSSLLQKQEEDQKQQDAADAQEVETKEEAQEAEEAAVTQQISPKGSQEGSYDLLDEEEGEVEAGKNLLESFNQSDFEHLSNYDPDDEFLQSSSSISLLQSIVMNKNYQDQQSSEYSIIDDSQSQDLISLDSSIMSKGSIRFIKSQKKVADAVVKKIIYYISLFSDEVRDWLQKFGKDIQTSKEGMISEESIDLKEIKIEFIEVILSILEHYDLIKLCLILCNRFKLTSKLGRYVVSSCLRYQSIQHVRFMRDLDSFKSLDAVQNQKLRQQALVGHEAVHNVFTLVDPAYLSLKSHGASLNSDNSLGLDNFRLMFALGFWKKLVYTMSQDRSLDLCYKFTDLYNFNALMDRLDDSCPQLELHQAQQTLINLKLVNTIMGRVFLGFKPQGTVDVHQQFLGMVEKLQQELMMQQVHEKPYVQDLVNLVCFILVPDQILDVRQDVAQKNKKDVININLIGGQEKNSEEQLRLQKLSQELYKKHTELGTEMIVRTFAEMRKTKQDMLIQAFMAYIMLTYSIVPGKIALALRDQKVYSTILEIFKQAQDNAQTNNQSLYREALYAATNLQALDCTSFFDDEATKQSAIQKSESLYNQYEKTHVLVSVNCQWISEFSKLQKRALKYETDMQYMQQAQQLYKTQYRQSAKQDAIVRLKNNLLKNMNKVDLKLFNQLGEQKSNCAFMIDMDLQFMMVPKEWVQTIVAINLQKFQSRLNEQNHNMCFQRIQSSLDESTRVNMWVAIFKHFLLGKDSKHQTTKSLIEAMIEKTGSVSKLQEMKLKLRRSESKMIFKDYTIGLPKFTGQINNTDAQHHQNNMYTLIHNLTSNDFEGVRDIATYQPCVMEALKADTKEAREVKSVLSQLGTAILYDSLQIQASDFDQLNHTLFYYLRHSIKIMNFCDSLPLFIDEITYIIDRGLAKVKKIAKSDVVPQKDIFIAFRAQAYELIALKHGQMQDFISRSLISFRLITPCIPLYDQCYQLEKMFYTLLVGMSKESNGVYVPVSAVKHLDAKVDYSGMTDQAEEEDKAYDYDMGIEDDQEEPKRYDTFGSEPEYYDEWDRPEINEVKQLQLEKRKSNIAQRSKSILSHKIKVQAPSVDKIKAQQQMRVILDNALELARWLNTEEFNESIMLSIFNVVISVCANMDNIQAYKTQLELCFQEFDQSCISDKFMELLFQYTENPASIRRMFLDTDDYQKYQFFAQDQYLFNIKIGQEIVIVQKNQKGYDAQEYRWLAKRVDARLVMRKCIRENMLKGLLQMKKFRAVKPKLLKYGILKDIQKIEQKLPNLPKVFVKADQFEQRLQALQSYCISSQTHVSCYEIQLLLTKYRDYEMVQAKLIQDLNQWVSDKAAILGEFSDVGDVDVEVGEAIQRATDSMDKADGEIVRWSMLAEVRKKLSGREDDILRAKRMQIKWKQWEDLSKRHQKLQKRIARLKYQKKQ